MIRLIPMDAAQFDVFRRTLIQKYAADNLKAGRWTADEAEPESRKEIDRLLPAGAATPNHLVLSVMVDSVSGPVGVAWLAIEPRGAFIYDIEIFETYRRRGYAAAALRLLEVLAKGRGAQKILLHVFGDNVGARRLYTKLGYGETNVLMAKPLDPAPSSPS